MQSRNWRRTGLAIAGLTLIAALLAPGTPERTPAPAGEPTAGVPEDARQRRGEPRFDAGDAYAMASPDRIAARTAVLQTTGGRLEIVADELLVTVRPGVDRAGLDALAAELGVEVAAWMPRVGAARLRLPAGQVAWKVQPRVAEHPMIAHAGPNAVMRAAGYEEAVPVDDGYRIQGAPLKVRWDGSKMAILSSELPAWIDGLLAVADEALAATVPYETLYGATLALEAAAQGARDARKAQADAEGKAQSAASEAAKKQAEADERWTVHKGRFAAGAKASDVAKALEDASKKQAEADAKASERDAWSAMADQHAAAAADLEAEFAEQAATCRALGPALGVPEAFVAPTFASYAKADDAVQAAGQAENKARGARDAALKVVEGATKDARDAIRQHEEGALGAAAPLADLQWTVRYLDLKEAVRRGISGAGVTVAVLDTGVAFEPWQDDRFAYDVAPDLAHVAFVAPFDALDGDAHPNDVNGHGTQMATLIAGVGAGYAIAPNVQLMPVRVLDDERVGTEAALVEGLLWAADHGADVINMSLAFPEGYVPSPALERAVALARAAGAVLVAAVGNAGADYTPYPAAFAEVLAVGASEPVDVGGNGRSGQRARYSNGDSAVDVMAPMGSLDRDTDGDGMPDAAFSMAFAPGHPTDFQYFFTAGTSGAAAEASAVAALLLEAGDPPWQVRGRIMRTTERTGMGTDPLEPGLGAGQLDAGASVSEALAKPWDEGCGTREIFVNPVGAIVAPSASTRRAVLAIEVLDGDNAPVAKARVMGHLRGARNERVDVVTDGKGVARYESEAVAAAAFPEGLAWQLDVQAVQADEAGCGKWVKRPLVFTRIDEASLEVMANFGTGLGASSLVGYLDPSAGAALSGTFRGDTYVGTYVHRTFGTGLGASSLVGLYDRPYMESYDLMRSAVIVRTYGTGLGASSLVVDYGFLDPSRLAGYTSSPLIVRSYPVGTGLGASSLVGPGGAMSWTTFMSRFQSDPGVMRLDYGEGQSAMTMVLDRSRLSPALHAAGADDLLGPPASGGLASGTGLGASSRVASYSPTLVTTLGYYAPATDALYTGGLVGGMGFESQALLMGYTAHDLARPLAGWTVPLPEPIEGKTFGQMPLP